MNTRQVVERFLSALEARDFEGAAACLADDFEFSGQVPTAEGKEAFLRFQQHVMTPAFPDLKFGFQMRDARRDVITGSFHITGTHLGPLSLPGYATVPPTGRRIALPEEPVVFVIKGGRITSLRVELLVGGGTAGLISQVAPAKTQLLRRINTAWIALDARLSMVTREQMSARMPGDTLSVKDLLAQIMVRETGLAAVLERRDPFAATGFDPSTLLSTDQDSVPTAIRERYRDVPEADVLNGFRETHRRLLAALARLTDVDLLRPSSSLRPDEAGEDNESLLGRIARDTYELYDRCQQRLRSLTREA